MELLHKVHLKKTLEANFKNGLKNQLIADRDHSSFLTQ
ncbi:hypothetical protein SAMN05444394_0079 [Algoriphagus halophilus]|uniref:Uncharacterized protein n=1 Tax=Algoriphagus halophilus TaxID=226505 RepID=A0A1N6D2X2_9BACT|nr:hypothetical protein SAMN05444394_0079 [Algoriphagus halophilus]